MTSCAAIASPRPARSSRTARSGRSAESSRKRSVRARRVWTHSSCRQGRTPGMHASTRCRLRIIPVETFPRRYVPWRHFPPQPRKQLLFGGFELAGKCMFSVQVSSFSTARVVVACPSVSAPRERPGKGPHDPTARSNLRRLLLPPQRSLRNGAERPCPTFRAAALARCSRRASHVSFRSPPAAAAVAVA